MKRGKDVANLLVLQENLNPETQGYVGPGVGNPSSRIVILRREDIEGRYEGSRVRIA